CRRGWRPRPRWSPARSWKPGSKARNCRTRIRCACTSTACAPWSTSRSRPRSFRPGTASATGSPGQTAAADTRATPARRPRRYRRRLRSRIIVSFVLLGFGLTVLFAFLTQEARNRVENALVEDVMNRNIDEYARRYYLDPSQNPD